MKKSWGMIPKIISGEKKIESRWSVRKSIPWGRVKKGDTIYFKNSGGSISAKAKVSKVIEIENLNAIEIKNILTKFGHSDGIAITDYESVYNRVRNAKYCLLIYLKSPQKTKPFNINKKGYGAMSAWISVKQIQTIKI